jgi:hypothetical protein
MAKSTVFEVLIIAATGQPTRGNKSTRHHLQHSADKVKIHLRAAQGVERRCIVFEMVHVLVQIVGGAGLKRLIRC